MLGVECWMFTAMDKTELRCDPLTGGWILFSEARVRRPTERIEHGTPELDPFAPGALPNLPASVHEAGFKTAGAGLPQVRVLAHRAPQFSVEGDPAPRGEGFYDRMKVSQLMRKA